MNTSSILGTVALLMYAVPLIIIVITAIYNFKAFIKAFIPSAIVGVGGLLWLYESSKSLEAGPGSGLIILLPIILSVILFIILFLFFNSKKKNIN